jgi:hypothetical protein
MLRALAGGDARVPKVVLRPRQQKRQLGLATPRAALKGLKELKHPLAAPLTAEKVRGGEEIWSWGLHVVAPDLQSVCQTLKKGV